MTNRFTLFNSFETNILETLLTNLLFVMGKADMQDYRIVTQALLIELRAAKAEWADYRNELDQPEKEPSHEQSEHNAY